MDSMLSENRKIGLALTGLGAVFLFLGIMMFFDRALLALGNLLFLVGFVFLIGVERTMKFFFQRKRLVGTIPFLIGATMVLFGWAFLGMLIELFGIINLFKNFFPQILTWLTYTPVIGPIVLAILRNPLVVSIRNYFRKPVLPTTRQI